MKSFFSALLSFVPSALAENAGAYSYLGVPASPAAPTSSASTASTFSPVLVAAIQIFAPFIVQGVFFGILSHKLAVKKGYKGYFWTGFFLSIAGLIYVAGLPVNEKNAN